MRKTLVTLVALIVSLISSSGYSCNMSVQQNGVTQQTLMTEGDTTLNFKGTGVVVSNSGSESATVNLTGLQTTQSVANASSITTLQSGLATTNGNVTTLQNGLATTNSNLAITNTNVSNNSVAIANETVRSESAEGVLTNGLSQTNSQMNVNTQNIAVNTSNIGSLYTGLNNETARAEVAETSLQNQVNATNQQVSNLSNQVSDLQRFKVMPEADIRVYDAKHLSLVVYDSYDSTNGRNFAGGVKVMLKLGKSYEERKLDAQEQQIKMLEKALQRLSALDAK